MIELSVILNFYKLLKIAYDKDDILVNESLVNSIYLRFGILNFGKLAKPHTEFNINV